jgi:NAD(P)-dependent dehydrogenase (short-subunit alcohol dehydrogenase family)
MARLEGKVALISGGARGLGAAFARAFAQEGAKLVFGDIDDAAGRDVEGAIRAGGGAATYLHLDVTRDDDWRRAIEVATELHGRLDILVNNAGVAQHGETHDFTEENYRRLMDINIDSVFRSCQAALSPMRKQQAGVMLNIGSISGMISNIPQPQAAYNASKAAVHMLTKSLASDYAAENIRVNAIAPGYIDTDMTAGGYANPDWAPVWRSMTPMPKVGTPEDIGAAALYLCSPASGYVTGEVLVIDGGYLTR